MPDEKKPDVHSGEDDAQNNLDSVVAGAEQSIEQEQQNKEVNQLADQLGLSEDDISSMEPDDIEKLLGSDAFQNSVEPEFQPKKKEETKESTDAEGDTGSQGQASAEEDQGKGEETGEEEGGDNPNIPRERLNKEIGKRKEAENQMQELAERVAFLEGQQSTKQPEQQQSDPIQVIDNTLGKLNNETQKKINEVWEKADEGEIKLSEARAAEAAIEADSARIAKIWQDRKQAIVSQRSQPSPDSIAKRIQSNPSLQQNTERLKEENPWMDTLNDRQFTILQNEAMAALKQDGIALSPDAESTWLLRQKIAEVGRELGFDNVVSHPAQNQDEIPLSGKRPTVQQRQQKVDLRNSHPPASSKAGLGGSTSVEETYEVEKMSEDDLANLPATVLEKLANGG